MSARLQGKYHGTAKPLFMLYVKTALLTLFTLGIYRFWGKTRIRKYIWSGVSLDGDSFEYTGTGLEKFLGFLVAIVILAVYLGIVQMILFFLGFNILQQPETELQILTQVGAIYLTAIAVVPLLLFAQYRARRYKMGRTRWRGLRFGMENGAWGYVGRALLYYFLAVISLGILTPLLSFRLEKYMAERTWYGDARFEQLGNWQGLFPGFKHVLIGLGIVFGCTILGAILAPAGLILSVIGGFVGYIWFLIGFVYYRVYAFNYLTSHKLLDGRVAVLSEAKTSEIVKIVIIGWLVIGFLASVILGAIGAVVYSQVEALMLGEGVWAVAVSVFMYVVALLVMGGLVMVMITQPIIEHIVGGIELDDEDNHLDQIRQRAADLGADAEGFADALDVGGAI